MTRPPNMEAPGPLAGGDRAQGTSDNADSKEFAKLAALAAMGGAGLYALADGGFLLTRWGLQRELPDLRAVAELLRRMGVSA